MARRRVLLVGGDPQVTAVLSEHLRHGDSYDVESFDYCDDALTVLRRQPFDLVLVLSFNAPWRTWPSLKFPARRIGSASAILFLKQMRALPSPPRVIVSALALMSPQAKEEALANGAFALLPKPVILAELDRLVVRALEAEAGDR
jgi:CheY-like chemotaxis protein